MGSSRPRNSTRAAKARSVKPPPKPRRRPDCKPSPVPERLSYIRQRLMVAMAAAYVASAALNNQGADCDADAALLVQRCVADEMSRQIDELDALIGGDA